MVIRRILHNFLRESCELRLGGQFAINKKEARLKEAGVIGKLFDWISTVLENSFISVDIRNLGDAIHGVHVSWIIDTCHSSSWALNLSNISSVYCAVFDWQFVALTYRVQYF